MPNVYCLSFTREQARILGVLMTRQDADRDLRTAARAMEIDRILREETGDYDVEIEAVVDEMGRLSRRYASRPNDPTYLAEVARLNAQVQDLDESVGQEQIDLLLDEAQYRFVRDTFLAVKGVPADRRNGPKYQAIREAINRATKSEVSRRGLSPVTDIRPDEAEEA